MTETEVPIGYNAPIGVVAIDVGKTTDTKSNVIKYLDANGDVVDAQVEISVTVSHENDNLVGSVQIVVNKNGSALPSTGGIGIMLLYIIGGLLMTDDAILMITKEKTEWRYFATELSSKNKFVQIRKAVLPWGEPLFYDSSMLKREIKESSEWTQRQLRGSGVQMQNV